VARKISVDIIGNSKSLERAFDKSSKSASGFGKSMAKAGKYAAIGLGAGLAGVAVGLKKSVDAALESEKAQARLDQAFQATTATANQRADAMDSVAKVSARAALDDEDLMDTLGRLTRVTGDVTKAQQGMGIAADLARARNLSLEAATKVVEKAYLGNVGALKRIGIEIPKVTTAQDALKAGSDTATAAQIRAAKAADDTATRQSAIAALQTQYAGAAKAYGETAAGSQERFQVAVENLQEAIGAKLLPVLTRFLTWITANMPAIERFTTQALAKIDAAIKFLTPTFQFIGRAIQAVAAAAQKYWPQVQKAAQQVVAWYQGTLRPAIDNVIKAVTAIWNKFGADITKIAKIAFGTLAAVVGNALKIVQAVIEGVLAVIRGDWSKAWSSLQKVVTTVLSSIGSIIKGFASIAFAAATAIGRGLIDGIIAGVSGLASRLKDSVTSQIQGAISGIKGAFGIGSPSKVTAKEIGGPLAEGVGMGFINGMKKVNAALLRELTATGKQLAAITDRRAREDRAAAVRSAIEAVAAARKNKEGLVAAERDLARAREDIVVANLERTMAREQAVYDRRQTLIQSKMDKLNAAIQKAQDKQSAIFDKIRNQVMRAFEGVRGSMQTPAEKALAELNENATQRDLQRALNDAIASGDAQAILRAQEDIQRNSLEKQAATERTALDQQTEALREKLGEKLEVWKGGTASILSMLAEFGIDFANVGVLLGTAFRDSLISAIGGGGAVTPAVAGGSGIAARSQAWNQAYGLGTSAPSSSVVNVYGDVTGTQLVETVRREINRIQKQNSRTGYV
jgi:hypothetical protein